MSYIAPHRRNGYCAVMMVSDSTMEVRVARNEREPLLQACQSGAAWYDAIDLFGDLVHLRCDQVAAISDNSPAAIVAAAEVDAEQKRHELTDP